MARLLKVVTGGSVFDKRTIYVILPLFGRTEDA
jgi:hypothetical protein